MIIKKHLQELLIFNLDNVGVGDTFKLNDSVNFGVVGIALGDNILLLLLLLYSLLSLLFHILVVLIVHLLLVHLILVHLVLVLFGSDVFGMYFSAESQTNLAYKIQNI